MIEGDLGLNIAKNNLHPFDHDLFEKTMGSKQVPNPANSNENPEIIELADQDAGPKMTMIDTTLTKSQKQKQSNGAKNYDMSLEISNFVSPSLLQPGFLGPPGLPLDLI